MPGPHHTDMTYSRSWV